MNNDIDYICMKMLAAWWIKGKLFATQAFIANSETFSWVCDKSLSSKQFSKDTDVNNGGRWGRKSDTPTFLTLSKVFWYGGKEPPSI